MAGWGSLTEAMNTNSKLSTVTTIFDDRTIKQRAAVCLGPSTSACHPVRTPITFGLFIGVWVNIPDNNYATLVQQRNCIA